MNKLSVVINTKNAEGVLEECLKSVSFADEIVIVDMHSSDKTCEIAEKYKAKIYFFKDVGYVEPARNFAIQKASNEWVLIIDADERVPLTLKNIILKTLENPQADVYKIPRKNIIFTKWINSSGWWPDYQVRLFKKGSVFWQDKIHSKPIIKGKVKIFEPKQEYALLHLNYTTVDQYLKKIISYTLFEASKSKKLEHIDFLKAFFDEFFYRFFSEKGYLQSDIGVVLAILQSFYAFVVQLRIWEANNFKDFESSSFYLKKLESLSKDLKYWIFYVKYQNSKGFLKIFWKLRMKFKI